ncbi:MAG: hypothetical protein IPK66_08785 [Rhodospirillales bacterium]|nr:hypothetical protein [Rhodospirillales bacterium]
MTHTTAAERALFSDLTRLFMSMKDHPHVELEARIEERFREFMRGTADEGTVGLQITMTWEMPDGPGDWAVYRTDYKTLSDDRRDKRQRALAGGGAAAILEFPAQLPTRSLPATGTTGQVIAFPKS